MAFWQLTRIRVVYPVILFFLLFVDGAVMSGMGAFFTAFPWHVLPSATLIWLFYGVQFDVDKDMPFWIYVTLTGILFDAYYTGIFGTYTVAFLIATMVMKQAKNILDERLLSGLTMFLFGSLTFLVITYFAGYIIGIANVSIVTFLLFEVLPTVALNAFFAVIGYFPVWSFFNFLR